MSGNKSFARSMNGINNIEINEVQFPDGSTITSASNLVQLDTTNDFTSNNSFNNNLPTSTKTPEVGDLTDVMILNKYSADLLYSGTDENDYPTAFTRNGTTGEITLTTADTGTPLSGDTSITSITDAQISAITNNATAITNNASNISTNASNISTNTGNITTNASAISSLTTNTNPCFKSASIDGQTLSLTPISGSATNITIPSSSAPSNMMTTNTTQTVSGFKSFTSVDGVQFASVGLGSGTTGGGTINMPYAFAIFSQNQGTAKITTQGKIGIGTTSPTFPLHIKAGNTGASESIVYTYFRHYNSSIGRASGWGADKFSLFADFTIMSAQFTGASDVRIKKDIMDLSTGLQLIEQIKPRTYKYIDPKRGDKMAYGFIAQELEAVIPELIKTTQHKIPNIMKTADVSGGVFTLKEATDLIEGDKIDIYDEDDTELSVKITEIISYKSFKTNIDTELKDKYFIYGKYVDDFKGIEHNGLLPIMMKGIQELNAKVKELEDKINNI